MFQNWWPMQGDILFIPSAGEMRIRKDVNVTQVFTEPVGYWGFSICSSPPGARCFAEVQLLGWCLYVACRLNLAVSHHLIALHWLKLSTPWLSHHFVLRWHLAWPIPVLCVAWKYRHTIWLLQSWRNRSRLWKVQSELFSNWVSAFNFFYSGPCNEFSELKSDCQGRLFTASKT